MDVGRLVGEYVVARVDWEPSEQVDKRCRSRVSGRGVWQLVCDAVWVKVRGRYWQARQETSTGMYSGVLWVAAQQFQSRLLGVKR